MNSSDSGAGDGETRHRRISRVLIIPIFMASGATSLIYETVWARQLHLVFGTSQVAISTVLAAFMAGLALGALFVSHRAQRTRHPLAWYAALELFIGGYAFLFPVILERAEPLYLGFWLMFEPTPLAFGGFQFVLVGLLLLPPTMCMGATLPLLVRFVVARSEDAGWQVGRLYGANTLGAVIGTGLAGFVLLPYLGVHSTTYWAALANLLLALSAFALAGVMGPVPLLEVNSASKVGNRDTEGSLIDPPPSSSRALIIVAGLAGFSSLLCEVAWFRLTALMLGGSAYAFSIMLLAFLLGIGIGGWVGGWMADRSFARGGQTRVLGVLMLIQIQVACWCWIAMYFYSELPFIYVGLYQTLEDALYLMWPAMLALPLAIMFLPALCMGATFPYLVRAMAKSGRTLSHSVGRLYGMNTIGAIVGAAGGGLVLLPFLHMRGAVLAAVSVNLIAALIVGITALSVSGQRRRGVIVVSLMVTLSAIVVVHWHKPPWDPRFMAAGLYSYVTTLSDLSREGVIEAVTGSSELVFYEEGLSSVVTVERDPYDGNIFLANNGKVEASLHDMDTQVLLAHMPFAFAPEAERVLVIGLASGITLGSVTLHPAREIDLVELEPAVVAASHAFDAHNNRPLEDPRVRLIVNDARNVLTLAQDSTYDLVSAQPSNPWLTGVSNLFTREFFELGKQKLRPGGVWVQWLQTYSMGTDDVRSLLATFADVYEYVRVFRVGSADLLVVGSQAELSLSVDSFKEIFQNDQVVDDLQSINVERPEHLLGLHQFSRDTLVELADKEIRNTDDNMRIEYSAPLKLFEDTLIANVTMLDRHAEVTLEGVEDLDGLLALARTYADHDLSWQRAFHTLQYVKTQYPKHPDVIVAYNEALENIRVEQE